jgi:predicted alpha/beta-hydrolase family hydrolase
MLTLRDGPAQATHTLVLAHGAGAAMDSPFMNDFARLMAEREIAVVRFEFPYMQKKRAGESRRAPDRMPVLEACFREVLREVGDPKTLFVGGKSMGSRVATQLADELEVRGAIALGYPFHPPKEPAKLRVAHLENLRTPTLIVQGTRDPFGLPAEIASYPLSPAIKVHYLEDGDHSFEPRKSSGRTEAQNLNEAADAVSAFMRAHRA